jgi:hypothetical protein
MLWHDQNARRLHAAEHVERLRRDAARAAGPAPRHRRRARRWLPLAAGLELAERARRWAAHAQPEL